MGTRWKWVGVALLLAGTAFQTVLAERNVYRCVYPGGLIEFRGVSVPGVDCVLVESAQVPASRAASAPERQPTPVARTDGLAEPLPADDPQVQNCEAAQHNLRILEGDGPVVSTGPDGQTVLMSDDERASMLLQTRRDVDYWCEDP